MDISEYIDTKVQYLFNIGVYDKVKDKNRIYKKAERIKTIIKTDSEYQNMEIEDIIKQIDILVQDAIQKHLAKQENNDKNRKFHSMLTGDTTKGITLLEKESITTKEPLEIAYATIGNGSIHLHCGISRQIDYIEENGKPITHYHNLLRQLKKHIAEKYNIHDKQEIEKLCSEMVFEPYIEEVLTNALHLYEKYPHLKTIRLDTNDGFFRQMKPYLDKYGFHECRTEERLEELSREFPNYNFKKDLSKFEQDYPDRKNAVTIHCKVLKDNMEKLKQEKASIYSNNTKKEII